MTSATIIGTTIITWHQLRNLSPMTESDKSSSSSRDIKTNQKSDIDLNSGASRDASEYSEALKDLSVKKYIKNGKVFWKCNLCKKEFSCWNITKVVMDLAQKEKPETLFTVNLFILK